MDIYEAFETSETLTRDGRWIDCEFGGEVVCSMRVRSASPDLNAELRKAMADEAVSSIAAAPASLGTLTDAVADKDLENRLFAHAVVTDWKGVTDSDGTPYECTPENVIKVFTELPLLAQRVKSQAYKWTNFRSVHEDNALGNS